MASDSDIPPTPLETIFTFARSLLKSLRDDAIASQVPPTSVLIITFSTFLDSWPNDSNKSPALSSFCFNNFLSFSIEFL